jgi:spectinomycin phosphotransferase/16S rRNA (guanine(1405)-N(7))-methyltransferase
VSACYGPVRPHFAPSYVAASPSRTGRFVLTDDFHRIDIRLRRTRPAANRRRVHTPPADLPEPALRAALAAGWSLRAATLAYRPVGFGSHHWEVTDTGGARRFVTVDDLRTRRVTTGEPLAAGYDRLRSALTAAQALRAAGRDFVVAPLPARDGGPLTLLAGSFAVAVYPFVAGESFDWGNYTPEHCRAVLDLLVAVHTAPPEVHGRALPDDYAIAFRDTVTAALDGSDKGDPGLGPYARPAAELLTAYAPGVRRALAGYDNLVSAARADPPALVLTHGEPHPGNTMRTDDGWLLIDWDTALVAAPERDLWDLDPGDGTLRAAYTAATGAVLRPGLLDLYRLRWDLTEIAGCLARFRGPHGATADDEESFAILEDLVTRL